MSGSLALREEGGGGDGRREEKQQTEKRKKSREWREKREERGGGEERGGWDCREIQTLIVLLATALTSVLGTSVCTTLWTFLFALLCCCCLHWMSMQSSADDARAYALAAGVMAGASVTLLFVLVQHACLHVLPGNNPYGVVDLESKDEEEEGSTRATGSLLALRGHADGRV
eukprot:581493-Hanusia_phi.AAC.2